MEGEGPNGHLWPNLQSQNSPNSQRAKLKGPSSDALFVKEGETPCLLGHWLASSLDSKTPLQSGPISAVRQGVETTLDIPTNTPAATKSKWLLELH